MYGRLVLCQGKNVSLQMSLDIWIVCLDKYSWWCCLYTYFVRNSFWPPQVLGGPTDERFIFSCTSQMSESSIILVWQHFVQIKFFLWAHWNAFGVQPSQLFWIWMKSRESFDANTKVPPTAEWSQTSSRRTIHNYFTKSFIGKYCLKFSLQCMAESCKWGSSFLCM